MLALLLVIQAAPATASPPYVLCAPGPYVLFFARDVAVLGPEARHILDGAAEIARSPCGRVPLTVVAHRDVGEPSGADRRRGRAVAAYLRHSGVRRLRIRAMAATVPRIINDGGPEAQNQRVEILFGDPARS